MSNTRPEAYCVGADQVLIVGGQIVHKPLGRADAGRSIAALSGRTHSLISAFCLARAGRAIGRDSDRASLKMRQLDQWAIERYLDLAGPSVVSSVGAYQVESVGLHLFEAIEGEHSTILGLPMLKFLAMLRREGLLAL